MFLSNIDALSPTPTPKKINMCAVNKYRKNKKFKINEITFCQYLLEEGEIEYLKAQKKFQATGEK